MGDGTDDAKAILAALGDLITRYRVLTIQLERLLRDLEQIEGGIAAQRAALEALCLVN